MTNLHLQSGRSKAQNGFTIVETLVAVAVLMIAVAGPLVVATKGLNSALASKNQMIASYLAQDTMETIKNIRDNNLASLMASDPDWTLKWLTPTGYISGSRCDSDSRGCDINGVNGSPLDCGSLPCPIYYNDTTGYTNSGGSRTVFTRYFYLEAKADNNFWPEVLVHVIVDWKEGTVPYQIHLTSQLVATTR